MIIKVCGMRDPSNIAAVANCGPDMMGMIFYEGSERFVNEAIVPEEVLAGAEGQTFVGVFVNATIDGVMDTTERYQLGIVQLHGDESPAYCRELRDEGMKVIKAIPVASEQDLTKCDEYSNSVDLFLFDTKSALRGGSGKKFNWDVLGTYDGETPFLLSGGIGPGDVEAILQVRHPGLYGVDINSGFEVEPGVKDVEAVREFIIELRGES